MEGEAVSRYLTSEAAATWRTRGSSSPSRWRTTLLSTRSCSFSSFGEKSKNIDTVSVFSSIFGKVFWKAGEEELKVTSLKFTLCDPNFPGPDCETTLSGERSARFRTKKARLLG